MNRAGKIRKYLFYFVAFAALMEQLASVVHLATSYGWANVGVMGVAMAGITVLSSAILTILLIETESGASRFYILTALVIVAVAEWLGNFWVGLLVTQHNMPLGAATIFGWRGSTGRTVAAFLYAGVIPMTVFLQVLAIAKWAGKLLEEVPANEFAEAVFRRHSAG